MLMAKATVPQGDTAPTAAERHADQPRRRYRTRCGCCMPRRVPTSLAPQQMQNTIAEFVTAKTQ